jgi:hypothetical protein
MKIPLRGAELFLANGRTDMTKLILALRNFANEPKNHFISLLLTLFLYPSALRHFSFIPFNILPFFLDCVRNGGKF